MREGFGSWSIASSRELYSALRTTLPAWRLAKLVTASSSVSTWTGVLAGAAPPSAFAGALPTIATTPGDRCASGGGGGMIVTSMNGNAATGAAMGPPTCAWSVHCHESDALPGQPLPCSLEPGRALLVGAARVPARPGVVVEHRARHDHDHDDALALPDRRFGRHLQTQLL